MYESKEVFYAQRAADASTPIHPEAKIRYNRAMKWLPQHPYLSIGEIGCNYGHLIEFLTQRGQPFKYHGIDIDAGLISKLRESDAIEENRNVQLSIANVDEGIPFANNSMDFIFAFEVMEHLENPTRFLAELKRCLQTDGRVAISVPNPYFWGEVYGNWRQRRDEEGHISSFTYGNIDALLKFSGLKLVDRQGTYTRLPFSRRLLGKTVPLTSDALFLTRSFMFLLAVDEDT